MLLGAIVVMKDVVADLARFPFFLFADNFVFFILFLSHIVLAIVATATGM